VRLEAHGLTVRFATEDGMVDVLDGVDLHLASGEIVDLSGPSGTGKSTLLMSLSRLLPGVEGDLFLDGVSAVDVGPQEWRSRVALVPQRSILVPGTVRDNLRLGFGLGVAKGSGIPDDAEMIGMLGSVGLERIGLDRSVGKLSVGQASRVSLVRTLLTSPECLLLDEPDANLDEDASRLVSSVIRTFASGGGAALRVRHHRVVEDADRRMRLSTGTLQEVD